MPARSASLLALAFVAVALVFGLTASAATVPPGFQETVVLSGLTEPTAMRIAPDGRVFVIEKGGQVKVFDSLSDPTASVYADLRTKVHSHDDRGMLGLALDPNFPAVPDIYVSYAHDAAIGGTAPRWGTPGANSDPCPTPPGPTIDGCVISTRLSRLSPASGGGVPYRDAVLADSPAGYWRLGETSGTSAADASGNGRTGSYVNTPTLGQAGALTGDSNPSAGFDGTSELVSVPYAAGLNTATTTLEAWVYPTGGQGRFRAVVSNRDYQVGATRGSILYASASNTWQYWVGNGSGAWTTVGGPAVTLNDWTHVAGTFDGSTARLYVDGTLVASAPSAYTPNPSRPLRVAAGANEGAANYLLPGRIDEAAVYPTALSSTRVRAHYDAAAGSSGSGIVEHVLIEDWCQQFTTGSAGGLAFGPDGELYMTAGAGGSYHFIDYGQRGQPPNPCGDPPGGVGATLSPPTSEGGWLRSQDLRTSGDPVGLGGTLIRVDRATGQGMPNNPLAGNPDPNARRIIAYGFRNPYRIAVRPGTRDVWVGDVGAGTFEEINRVPDALGPVRNFGWPCYEGELRSSGFDSADLTICENLYAQPSAATLPFFRYQHGQKVVPTETCSTTTGSATSGLAFTPANSTFPASYDNALFLADYSRRCIWVMFPDGSGIPNPATVTPFVQDASFPVDLQFGPDGNLYYVDVAMGSIRRISYSAGNQPPVAVATGSPTSGAVPLAVTFNGSGSSDPDGTIASYAWDLDGDGQYDDSTAQNPSRTYTTAGTHVVRLRVTDSQGAPDISDPITITAGSSAPTAFIDQPAPSFTWRAGDVIAFAGHGTDPEDGAIPASGLRWDVTLQHCSSPGNCHSHFVESFPGVASGSFSAPDHEYPSFLELKLTVTDSSSISSSETIALNPRTVTLTMQSAPSGLSLVVNNNPAQTTPFTATVVEGSINTVSAPSPQTLGATSYAFSSWSDGGGQTHTVTANSSATYAATYTPQGGGGPSYSSSVLADSPLAYWRLGESSGSTAADASGNGRTGSHLNTPTLGVGGALSSDSNTAVGFNGTDEYVSVPYTAALNPAQVAVEAWAYPTGGQGTFRSVVTSRDYAPGNARGYILYASSANTWQFWLGNGDWAVVYGPPIALNQWTHLVGTYDGTTARLYVNGALAASSGASGFLQNTVRPLRIASGATDKTNPQYYLPGRVDEVAVYGSALSATRVQAHFAAASSGGGNQPPNAVASGSPTSGAAPLSVNFNGSGSSDPDGTITGYAWDLDGDGGYDDSTVQSPSFQYTTAGTYNARLRVTDDDGAQDDSDPVTISVTGGGGPSYSSSVLADSPLAYWRLGESSGSTAADASGNGRTGSHLNTPTLGVGGALSSDSNTAVGFNGTDEYVSVPYTAALNPAQVAVEAWAYPTGGQGTFRSVVTSRDYAPGNARGYILYASSANTWQFWLGNGDWAVVYGPPIALNQWTHLVGTYDGTTARLYVNGALAASSGASGFLQNTVRPLRIASGATDKTNPQYYLPGRVDEVAVYGSALSATRVQAHFAAAS